MYRSYSLKTSLCQCYTWSRCSVYLQALSHRQLSESASFNYNEDKNDTNVFSHSKKNSGREGVVVDAGQSSQNTTGDDTGQTSASQVPTSRLMDRIPEDMYRRYLMKPDQPEDARLLRVAIIGAPNAGKSTLINSLMGWKVNSVSKKVHTTRQNTNTVFTIDNTQIILVDTPGVVTKMERKRHYCDGNLLTHPERSLHEADAVAVIVDASNRWTRSELHTELLKVLYLHKNVPSFLILNKIDSLRNRSIFEQQRLLLETTRKLSDGIMGGKTFAKTTLERKPKYRKEETPKDLFDRLEKKYGKINVKRKEVPRTEQVEVNRKEVPKTEQVEVNRKEVPRTEQVEVNRKEVPRTEQVEVNRKEVPKTEQVEVNRKEVPRTEQVEVKRKDVPRTEQVEVDRKDVPRTKQVNVSNNIHLTYEKYDKSQVKAELYKLITQKEYIGETDVVKDSNVVNETDKEFHKLITEYENVRESVVDKAPNVVEITESDEKLFQKSNIYNDSVGEEFMETLTENSDSKMEEQELHNSCQSLSVIEDDNIDDGDDGGSINNSDSFRYESYNFSKTDATNSGLNANIIEKSHQSAHLAHILSKQPLQEFSAQSQDSLEDSEIDSDWAMKVSQIQEAVQAAKDKHGWAGFDEVFLTSALDGSGIDILQDYLVKISQPSDWVYHSSVITDQHPYDIAKMCIIQSFLDNMDSYLPYTMDPEIIYWEIDSNNRLNISVDIKLANYYEMKLVFGDGSDRIRAVTASARQALMDAFQCEIRFKLVIMRRKK